MLRIRRDDTVMVMAGKDKGKTGKVVRVMPKANKAVIENINVVKKSVKKSDDLQLQLEEAIQMLRLVAKNQRTSVEIQEWLDMNYPQDNPKNEYIY